MSLQMDITNLIFEEILTAIFLFSSNLDIEKRKTSALFMSNISIGGSGAFYFNLNHFEAIFLGILIIKCYILRYLGFLPISLDTNGKLFFFDRPIKREAPTGPTTPSSNLKNPDLGDALLSILRKIDTQDCFIRTLCEVQSETLLNEGYKVPKEIKMVLSTLSKSSSARKSRLDLEKESNYTLIEERPLLSLFEEAIEIGWEVKSSRRNTANDNGEWNWKECEERYSLCPLKKKEILEYFERVKHFDVI